ncbi:MAG TPA: hypothetical protein DCO86_04530 [Spirochaetaceae bacterium]|nr:hypothetical protein [Spirochaetaceae bacterium]
MIEYLSDMTPAKSWRGAGEAGLGTESPMQDKALYLTVLRIRDYVVCLSKWLSVSKRAYPVHIRRLDKAE